jgi:hypothetical protein
VSQHDAACYDYRRVWPGLTAAGYHFSADSRIRTTIMNNVHHSVDDVYARPSEPLTSPYRRFSLAKHGRDAVLIDDITPNAEL